MVQLLIDAGASAHIRDKVRHSQKGRKPTDFATTNELLRLLSFSPDLEVKQPRSTYKSKVSDLETTARASCSAETLRVQQDPKNDRELREWLERNRLGFLFEPLRLNGFDNFGVLLDTMRSEVPLTKELLAPLNIKIGHTARVLGLLEIEARGDRETFTPERTIWCTNTTSIEPDPANLEEWLHHLNIGSLYANFRESGYDDLEHLRLLQRTRMKLTDESLDQEVGIKMLGWRHRVLMKLWQDTEVPVSMRSSRLEETRKAASCKDCRLM